MSLPQTDSPDLPWHDLARGAGLMQDSGALRSTIFDETSVLARAHGAVNLGQGFPDADGPAAIANG